MAPGKRVIQRIEHGTKRHVTFTKRRRGLLKKAQELAILCDCSIAVTIFSPTGKLFEYSSSNMHMIMQRYFSCVESANSTGTGSDTENLDNEINDGEVAELKRYCGQLEREIRQMNGKDLDGSSSHDLIELEMMIQKGLNRVKSKKIEQMQKQLDDTLQALATMEDNSEAMYQHLELVEKVKEMISMLQLNKKQLEEEIVRSQYKHDARSLKAAKKCGSCNEEFHACLCLCLKLRQ